MCKQFITNLDKLITDSLNQITDDIKIQDQIGEMFDTVIDQIVEMFDKIIPDWRTRLRRI